jgi:hypothetical protein
LRLDADLPQLPERRGNGAAKEKAGLRCRSAADKRRSRCVQHASRLGQQRAEVRAEAGREDDRVKAFGGRLLEVDALAGKACDARSLRYSPPATPNEVNRSCSMSIPAVRMDRVDGKNAPHLSQCPLAGFDAVGWLHSLRARWRLMGKPGAGRLG